MGGALIAAPAMAGWDGLQWDMTPAQVEAARPGVTPLKRKEKMGDKRAENGGPHRVGPFDLQARYFYDAKGLAMVTLPAPPKRCQEVVDHLVARHGRPIGISDQVMFRLLIWHDEPGETRIRLMYSPASICDLHFERLSDYRDYDLSQAKGG